MDYTKINFKSYVPSFEKYINMVNTDSTINKFVTFSKYDSKLIFFEDTFIGCFKTMIRDDDLPDKEIYIGILPEYRKKGISKYIINVLCNNIFESDEACEYIHLSIDKNNEASIQMAKSCGFIENLELENEIKKYGDDKTLIYSKRTPYINKKTMNNNL